MKILHPADINCGALEKNIFLYSKNHFHLVIKKNKRVIYTQGRQKSA